MDFNMCWKLFYFQLKGLKQFRVLKGIPPLIPTPPQTTQASPTPSQDEGPRHWMFGQYLSFRNDPSWEAGAIWLLVEEMKHLDGNFAHS